MNHLKILTIILAMAVILVVLFFGLKDSLFVLDPSSQSQNKENVEGQKIGNQKLSFENPFQGVSNFFNGYRGDKSSVGINSNNLYVLTSDQNQPSSSGGLSSSSVSISSDKAVSGYEIADLYYSELMEAFGKTQFTSEEFGMVKKNENGMVMPIEMLMEEAISTGNISELRNSFLAWGNLDKKTLENLDTLSAEYKNLSQYKALAGWFEYHRSVAIKLSEENLSSADIKNTADQFSQRAKSEVPKFKFAYEPHQEKKYQNLFGLIPSVYALSSLYDFGGLVVSYEDFCTNGFAFIVAGKFGGLLWIYYPVMAANPYLYKAIDPGIYILGRATYGPGWCNKAHVNYFTGMASILFYGTSLAPL